MSGKPLYPNNDDEPEYYIEVRDVATGDLQAATGIAAGMTVHLSATDRGPAIDATLSKAMAERTQTPGRYYARYEGSDLATHIAALPGVYEVLTLAGGNILTSVHRRVFGTRRPA